MGECDIEGDCLTTRTKCHALKVILDMSSRLLKLYKDCSSFTEIFKMLQSNLKRFLSPFYYPENHYELYF